MAGQILKDALLHPESCSHLDNAAAGTIRLDLPVRNELFQGFQKQHRRANPRKTRPEGLGRLSVLEEGFSPTRASGESGLCLLRSGGGDPEAPQ
jgi:hypothetical protein